MAILYTVLYACFIGFYNVFKKKAIQKSTDFVILVMFTSVCFLLAQIWLPFGVLVPLKFVAIFAVKGFLLSLSWYLTLKVLKNADLSLVSITNVLSVILSFSAGILLFNESVSGFQIVGSVLVVAGVTCINLTSRNSAMSVNLKQFSLLLICAVITAISTIIDKYTNTYLTTAQVQYWFLLFVFVFSLMFFGFECLKNKRFLIAKTDLKNWWIYLVGICLFVGDIFLFLAYHVPNSTMITISILSKLKIVITVLLGIIVFKEKNIFKKLMFSLLVIAGAVLISI